MLQRRAASQAEPEEVPPIVYDVLGSPGQPLDHKTRGFFEGRLGYDLSDVRVHADPHSAASARAVSALAYTVGRDVVFDAGRFRPETIEGRRLLAHELTHVMQQTSAPFDVGAGSLPLGNEDALEAEASAAESLHGTIAASTSPLVLRRKSGGTAPTTCGGTWTCAASPCDKPDPGRAGTGGTPSSWTLKVMIDVEAPSAAEVRPETIGHTYVEFSDSTGATYTYGFYPDKASGTPDPVFRPIVGGCTVHPDTTHKGCVDHEEVFKLSQVEYKAALDFAQLACKAPPNYNLQTFNCTTFAEIVAKTAGRSLPPGKGQVGSGMLSTIADNPNTMLEAIHRRDIGPTYGLTSDSAIRKAIAAAPTAELTAAPATEKIRVINRLLDGWVSDEDLAAIETLCASVSSITEQRQIMAAVHRREADIYSDADKKRFHNALNKMFRSGAP